MASTVIAGEIPAVTTDKNVVHFPDKDKEKLITSLFPSVDA